MREMGVAAFKEMKQSTKESTDPRANSLSRCVVNAIVEAIPPNLKGKNTSWEVVVFEDPTANAFALPGGKIGVHTGLFKVAKTPAQLAAVLGHEVAHVLAKHGNERVSQQLATQTGMSLAAAVASTNDPAKAERRQMLLGLIGVGAQVGILLPYSRSHESEADAMGLDLMARAGFEPKEAVALWKNMAAAGGGAPPEFLSTHPSNATRIADLQRGLAAAEPLYAEAKKAGRLGRCESGSVANK